MKIKFLGKSDFFPADLIEIGYSPKVELHCIQGEEYTVYGVVIWKNVTHYLVIQSGLTRPDWLPAEFFEVIDHKLPVDWYFRFANDPRGVSFIMGYKEMGLDENHRVGLIEREEEDLRIFYARKKEIDEI